MKSSIYFIYALFLFFVTSLFSLATAANSNSGVIDIPKTELSIFVPVGMKPTLLIPNKKLPDVANQAGWEFTFNTDNNGDKYILWNRDIAAAEFEVQGLLEDGKWVGIRKVNQYGIRVDNEILSFPKIRIGVCNYFGCNQLGTSNEIYISAQTGQFFTIPQITRPKFIPITYKDNFFLVPRKIDASSNHDFLLREKFVDAITYSNQLLLWNTSIDATEFEIQGLTEAGEWVTIKTVSQYGVEIDDAMRKFQKLRVRVCDYHGCGNLSVSKARKPTSDFLIPDSQPLIDPQLSSVENVGAIAAKAGVNGGAATYHIPVKLPPGRAEMQPNIALNYSSSSGIGIAGRGWSLSGLQSISRCDATVAQDGYSATPSYSASDKLCLNGQRLIAVSGTYGKNGTTYRTELDSFVRVTQVHDITMDSTYFGVRYKNGRVAYFGLNENSRVVHGDKTAAYSWLIAYEVDASGRNFIHYDYVTAGAGEQLISTISYTGDAADSKGRNTIEFTYEDKRQSSLRYVAGGRLESTKRMTLITTKVSNTQVNSYDLEYENNEANSTELLSSVTQCFATNSYCLPATKINWHNKPIHYGVKPVLDKYGNELADAGVHNLEVPDGDRNGDGVRDWPKRFVDPEGNSRLHTMPMPRCSHTFSMMKPQCKTGDFNQDGLTDIWEIHEGKLRIGISVKGGSPVWYTTDIEMGKYDTIVNIADYNGNSYSDLVLYREPENGGGVATIHLYTNSTHENTSIFRSSRKQLLHQWGVRTIDWVRTPSEGVSFPGDMDGDGIPDIAINKEVEITGTSARFVSVLDKIIYLNWANGNISTEKVDIDYSGDKSVTAFTMLFDVNGDGLQDWIGWRDPTEINRELYVAMNKGNRTFSTPYSLGTEANIPTRTKVFWRAGDGPERYIVAKFPSGLVPSDIDGDGKPELLVPDSIDTEYCVYVVSNTGNGFRCGSGLYSTYENIGANKRGVIVNLLDNIDWSVYKHKSYHFVYDKSSGKYSVQSKPTELLGVPGRTYVIDGFGKGLNDIVFKYADCGSGKEFCYYKDPVSGSQLTGQAVNKMYYNRNSGSVSSASSLSTYQPNAIVESIQDGLGRKARWKLLPLSSSQGGVGTTPHYETDHSYIGALDNAFHFSSSMYTVSRFEQSNGVGGMSAIEYAYKGAVFSADGRGFLGFRSIIEKNVDKSLITQSDFSQEFPRHGKLITKATFKAGDFDHAAPLLGDAKNETKAISHSEFKWVDNPSHWVASGKVYHDYLSKHIQVTRDINDLSTIIGTQSQETRKIDQYGNPTEIFSSTSDSWNTRSSQIVNVYDNDSTNWWLNKLTRTKTTQYAATNRHSNDALTLYQGNIKDLDIETHILRVMSDFHTSRKPKKIVESATSGKGKIISTVFNSYGLPTKVTTTAKVLSSSDTWLDSSRTEALSYSDDGYFAETVSNPKGHTVTTVTDAATGLPKSVKTQVKKYDYVTTTYSYDNYTRPYTEKTSGLPAVYKVTSKPDSNAPSYSAMQVTTQSAGKPTTKTYLDKFNRVLRIATQNDAGQWIYVDTGYDKQGNKTRESRPYLYSNPRYDIEYKNFDALGRPKSKVTPQYCGPNSHGEMTAQYEYIGLTTEISVSETCYGLALGTMSRSYSIDKQLIETQDALGGYTRYAYNSMGLPIVMRDANGNSIIAKYDGMGRKVQVNDPNQGQTTFTYNGFGEVAKEERSNNKTVNFYYDSLGRVISRKATSEGTQTFVFDTQSYGQLGEASANGVTHKYYYDNLGRPTIHDVTGDGQRFITYTFYDENYGRVSGMRYPNGLTLEYKYNEYGNRKSISNLHTGYVYQTVTKRDVLNNIEQQTLGNGVVDKTYYSSVTGQMTGHYTQRYGHNLLGIEYNGYDGFGNLKSMEVISGNVGLQHSYQETYHYDDLHRLTSNAIAGITTISYDYDAMGNLLKKSDYASKYDYDTSMSGHTGGGPNAVKRVFKQGQWVGFSYDARGNMTKGDGLVSAQYNALDKPTTITKNGMTSEFVYGPDHMRFMQATGDTTTYYAGKHYELEIENGEVTQRAFIEGVALVSKTDDYQAQIRYMHKDRLGSARVMTNRYGNVIVERNFDPFGKPRSASGGLKFSARLDDKGKARTNRGFTDHEHLDELELIHMNGRVYDYNLGRFMSVDPFIQAPGNSQSINPYSYIMNNPLAGTDPTGYIGCKVGDICTTSVDKKTEFVGKPLSRIQKRVETTTTTTTNSAGNVVNVSKTAQSGNNITFSSISYNSNGDITQVVGLTHNSKTGESASAAYDFGTQESIANASPTTMSSTAPSLKANWCYNGACRTGIMSSIDTRTIGQIDDSLKNLNSGFSALIGGVSGAGMFKALLTDLAEYVSKKGSRLASSKNPNIILVRDFVRGFSEGYSKLSKSEQRNFDVQARTFMCGFVMACAAKFSPGNLPAQVPKSPPSVRNLVNYLHKQQQTTPLNQKQRIDN